MTDGDGELRVLRARVEAAEEALARLADDEGGTGAARVAVTVSLGAYPAGSGSMRMFALHALDVTGAETEGASGVEAEDDTPFFALNVGSGLPPVGTRVIAVQVPHLWAFRYP